jgi:hypothetical protein
MFRRRFATTNHQLRRVEPLRVRYGDVELQ